MNSVKNRNHTVLRLTEYKRSHSRMQYDQLSHQQLSFLYCWWYQE